MVWKIILIIVVSLFVLLFVGAFVFLCLWDRLSDRKFFREYDKWLKEQVEEKQSGQ